MKGHGPVQREGIESFGKLTAQSAHEQAREDGEWERQDAATIGRQILLSWVSQGPLSH